LELQKQVSANVAGPPPVSNAVAVTKRVVHKRCQKKVAVKPKPKKAIDKEAIPDEEIQKEKKREGDDNSKKTHAFTSVLTARSKVGSENEHKIRTLLYVQEGHYTSFFFFTRSFCETITGSVRHN